MSEISRTALFGKLNALAYKAIEGATVFCKMRGNPYVELEHWFAQLLQTQDSDLHRVIQHYGLDVSVLAKDMTAALDRLPRGATAISDFSPHIENAIERAWTYATLQFGEAQVRTGYLLVGMLKTQSLRNPLFGLSKQFEKVKVEDLADNFPKICDASPESQMRAQDGTGMGSGAPGEDSGAMAPAAMGKGDALKKFAVDLTEKAKKGEMDPITGRDEEIRQIVDILMRRRQNNPLLTGEAGVGKTAVVEGFAQRLARGDVPPQLKDVKLLTLDIGLLQAGASMKGEFEQRLRQVIDEVQSSPTPIILFIDEIHTLVGAGGAAGTGDAANLLKPALARGNLRTIGATTWAEYKKYFEKDAALARRFQVVKVEEPDEDKAIHMLRGLLGKMREHHKVAVMDEALVQAVRLSSRYITGRQLPDKAVSVLDTACARIALAQSSQPGLLEDCRRQIDNLQAEIDVLGHEAGKGHDHDRRLGELQASLQAKQQQEQQLNEQWQQELALVEQLKALDAANDADAGQLNSLRAELVRVQGDQPLVHALVDSGAIAQVISGWTGIPLGKMLRDEIDTVQRLPALLGERVLGQDHALHEIGKRIKISRARMEDPNKPIGVFLLLGPSGVGKTETALALADTLYGGERNLITINMSEYQEAHTVSSLKGSPPGYVGYGEGGVLTEAVRRKPYSVVLLDEVEKAHPDVLELFFQVFDKGVLDDGEGREINFRNTVIILTSNTGTERIMQTCLNATELPTPQAIVEGLRDELNHVFKPAFLGRLSIVPFYPVQDQILERIVALKLARIAKRFARNHQAELSYDEALVKAIAARCTEVDSGARNIDNILSQTLMPELAQRVLERMAQDTPIERLVIELGSDGDFAYRLA